MRARIRALMVGLLLAGCADPPLGQPDPLPFTLQSADVWSGSSVTLTSPGFVSHDPGAVLLDSDTLLFSRVNDSTLRVALPDLPGTHQLRVVSRFVVPTEASIHLHGFLDGQLGPIFQGHPVRGAQLMEVFGNGPTGLRRWNVSTGGTSDYPDSLHTSACTRGVGAGPRIGELVLRSGATCGGRWQVWQIEPTVEHLDTTGWSSNSFVDVLRPGLYVLPGPHMTMISRCDTTCSSEYTRGESGFDVVHSPAGDRAVPLAYVVSDTGAPVIDVIAGRVKYYVAGLQSLMAAAFSDGGDTLYLAGQEFVASAGATLLLAVRAADGVPLMVDSLSYTPCGIAVDPVRSYLYVAGYVGSYPDRRSVLSVFDRASLEPIATLHADSVWYGFNPCRILPSPLERRVYVIDSFDGDFDIRIHATMARFETPP